MVEAGINLDAPARYGKDRLACARSRPLKRRTNHLRRLDRCCHWASRSRPPMENPRVINRLAAGGPQPVVMTSGINSRLHRCLPSL
jgi:hypothetical protein